MITKYYGKKQSNTNQCIRQTILDSIFLALQHHFLLTLIQTMLTLAACEFDITRAARSTLGTLVGTPYELDSLTLNGGVLTEYSVSKRHIYTPISRVLIHVLAKCTIYFLFSVTTYICSVNGDSVCQGL